MKRTVTDCDCCGKKSCETKPVYVKVGTQVGVQGVENRYQDFDLCMDCLHHYLKSLLEALDYEAGAAFAEKIKQSAKQRRLSAG